MPIYEYKCYVCEKLFDVEQRMTDPVIEKCQYCGGPVKRVFSPVGVIFKGSGFHVTDYGKEKVKEEKKIEEKSAEGPPQAGEGRSASGEKDKKLKKSDEIKPQKKDRNKK